MTTSSDNDYVLTKSIKKGDTTISSVFNDFVERINSEFSVNVLNVILDYLYINNFKNPRLNIIVENFDDYIKFYKSPYNFDKKIERKIKKIFEVSFDTSKVINYNKLFVIASNFRNVAIDEAHNKISEEKLQDIAQVIDKDNIWLIRKYGSCITVFLYKEKNYSYTNKKDILKQFTELYFPLLKKFDEFNYCKFSDLKVDFDTKENFEKNYQGNWYYYCK
ncbi:MAG TPA: hypothetical protein PK624_06290 [Spirochaetota bacterium]|nr:hypothetical protein [Spirochaetota bacterium]HOR44387.1 hypothetical protein [Spirochaetota bacterium]HOU85931.1 hypothetical protein [Spirochaetota bacterium]HPK55866.1 hypothetical protein [Spirochaetota bacterium]